MAMSRAEGRLRVALGADLAAQTLGHDDAEDVGRPCRFDQTLFAAEEVFEEVLDVGVVRRKGTRLRQLVLHRRDHCRIERVAQDQIVADFSGQFRGQRLPNAVEGSASLGRGRIGIHLFQVVVDADLGCHGKDIRDGADLFGDLLQLLQDDLRHPVFERFGGHEQVDLRTRPLAVAVDAPVASSSQSEIGHHVAGGGMVNSRPSSMNLNSASQLSKTI